MSRVHFMPVHRHPVIDRPQVVQHALAGDSALIIIRGGGGTGKSVTAAQIARAYADRTQSAHAVWVRFSNDQADVDGVWQQVFRTLCEAEILTPESHGSRLIDGGVPSTQAVIDAFRELPEPLLLILDDAHRSITAEVEESILHVLENISQLNIIITTRHSLPGLSSTGARMRVPICKVTAEDLTLTRAEVTELITRRVGETTNATAIAGRIHRESRGWPLAVHALLVEHESVEAHEFASLDSRHKAGTFIRTHVDGMIRRASPSTRKAICSTALFSEVTQHILAQVLNISVGEAQQIFDHELEDNIDYWADESGTRWYRFHDLVTDELRIRAADLIANDELRAIASRAARALMKDRPRLAMHAAILAEEWDLLSDLLLQGSALTLSRRQQAIALTDIPETVLASYPVLAAFALIHEYAFPAARIGKVMNGFRMLASRTLTSASEKPGLPGLTAALLRMVVARLSGNEKIALAMANRVQDGLQQLSLEERQRYSRPLQTGINQTVITLIHAGRFTEAAEILDLMHAWDEHLQPQSRAHAVSLAAWVHAWIGDMPRSRELLEKCQQITIPVDWHSSYIGAGYRIAAAIDGLESGNTGEAKKHMAAMAEHESTIEHWPFFAVVEALITESEDGLKSALDGLDRQLARRTGRATASATAKSVLLALRARLGWQAGKVLPNQGKRVGHDKAAVFTAFSQGEYAIASAVAATIGDSESATLNMRMRAELLLLQAEAVRRDGDIVAAAELAEKSAHLLKSHELTLPMRLIPLDSAIALQELAPDLPVERSSRATVREVRPLTRAERRALIEVIEQGSVPAAAKSMYLSQETVKGYLKQVYRKLGVNSRKEAIRVAGDAGLIGELREARGDD